MKRRKGFETSARQKERKNAAAFVWSFVHLSSLSSPSANDHKAEETTAKKNNKAIKDTIFFALFGPPSYLLFLCPCSPHLSPHVPPFCSARSPSRSPPLEGLIEPDPRWQCLGPSQRAKTQHPARSPNETLCKTRATQSGWRYMRGFRMSRYLGSMCHLQVGCPSRLWALLCCLAVVVGP